MFSESHSFYLTILLKQILRPSLNLNHIIVGSANGSQSQDSESIENVNTAQPLSDTASAKKPEPSCREEKASCQEPESNVSCQSEVADNLPHTTREVVDDIVKSNDQLRNEMVAASAGSKRKRKLSDDDNKTG